MQYYGNTSIPGAQIPLNFDLLFADRNNLVQSIDYFIKRWLIKMPENTIPNWVVCI